VEAASAPAPDQGADNQALEANLTEATNQEQTANQEEAVTQEQEDTSTEAEPSDQGGTRRVEWTIVKRTLADQRAAKAVSAVYVLKRDGVDTEFANLAAARAAVHKTIVHPEKLTRAKADYGSTKK
jgi:hypothetical protein